MKQKQIALAAAMLVNALPVLAEDAAPVPEAATEYTLLDAIKTGKPMTSFRLRYESVSQDGLGPVNTPAANTDLKDGKGTTLRSLIGWQTAPFHNFSFAAQLIDVSKLQDDYNDSTNSTLINGLSNQPGREQYAKIVDPDYTGVNQLYLDWTGIKNTRLRIGRQQVNLDNVRFVGDIGFRQVMQVFDGESVLNKSIPDTQIFLAHFNRVRQITTVLRNDGSLNIANVKYSISPTESVVGYAYLSSFEDLGLGRGWFGNAAGTAGGAKNGNANAKADQSNAIFGMRLDGAHKIDDDWKVLYTAEYAKQSDYEGGDDRIDAHYYKIGGGAAYGNFSLRADQELLSSNNGEYAFQTPFGTNHLFQGWVDKFLTTPLEGIRDTFVTATYKIGDFTFFADYHWLDSDENFHTVGGGMAANGDRYGKEWNVAASYAYNANISAKVEYGKFTEGDHYALLANTADSTTGNRGRFRDTDKLWLTLMYTF
jgi:hypothetical protein